MATATKKVSPSTPVVRGARHDVSDPVSLEFLVHQDNGGDYHWEIVGERGESLTQSESFASHDDAERAARRVYDGVGSARFEPDVAEALQLEAA
jgi:uncharacterized protein YegP (UPF0339 family)